MAHRVAFALFVSVLWWLTSGFDTPAAEAQTPARSVPELTLSKRLLPPLVDPAEQARRDLARWGAQRDAEDETDEEPLDCGCERRGPLHALQRHARALGFESKHGQAHLAPTTLFDRRAEIRRHRVFQSAGRASSAGEEPPVAIPARA